MRKPRILRQNAKYRVSAHANHLELLLAPDRIKKMFLTMVARAKKKYPFHLENFVVLDNCFHIIIQPEKGANLSEIMKWILGVFAMKYNRTTGLKGHFWGDRFRSTILSTPAEFERTFHFIDSCPVQIGLSDSPEKWRWGRFGYPLWNFG